MMKKNIIEIKVNGIVETVDADTSLLQYLQEHGYSVDTVMAAVNDKIIQPPDYSCTLLSSGCEVDLMTFVAGG